MRASESSSSFDIKEYETSYLLHFRIPGVIKHDLRVEIVDNDLVVSAVHNAEGAHGPVVCHYTFPHAIDAEHARATLGGERLTVLVPKRDFTKYRLVPVEDDASE